MCNHPIICPVFVITPSSALCFRWEGTGVNEIGRDKATGEMRVKVNPKYYRPTEVVSIARLMVKSCDPDKCLSGGVRSVTVRVS